MKTGNDGRPGASRIPSIKPDMVLLRSTGVKPDGFLLTGELTLSTLSRAAIAPRAAVLRSERARAGAITSGLRNTTGRSFSALSSEREDSAPSSDAKRRHPSIY